VSVINFHREIEPANLLQHDRYGYTSEYFTEIMKKASHYTKT
jgi:hypothetical protein